MPKEKPNRVTKMRLHEVSLVDRPANPGASVLIAKRADGPVDFNEALGEQAKHRAMAGTMDDLWDAYDALRSSVTSIIEDGEASNKGDLIDETMGQFKARITQIAESMPVLKAGAGDPTEAAVAAANYWKEVGMDIETLSKNLEAAEARLAEVEKRATDAEAEVASLKAENAALRKSDSANDDADDVLKNVDPAVRAMFEKQQAKIDAQDAELRKQAEARATADYIAKAAALNPLGVNADEFGPVLKRVLMGATEDDAKAVMDLLTKGAKLAEVATTQVGSDTPGVPADTAGADSALSKLNAKAEEIAKADGVTHSVAFTKAAEQNPKLYDEYMAAKGFRH